MNQIRALPEAYEVRHSLNTRTNLEESWVWPINDRECWAAMHHDHQNIPTYMKYLPEDSRLIAVQAGGNCGWMPRKLVEDVGFQVVFTFEPDPVNFFALAANCPHKNIFKIQTALGREHTKVFMNTVPGNLGMNYVSENQGVIPVLKIDDLNLEYCNFIQLDTEAYEYPILQGAVETLQRHKPVLSLELYQGRGDRYGYNLDILRAWLKEQGYVEREQVNMDFIFTHKDSDKQ